jgi:hypothetical protein
LCALCAGWEIWRDQCFWIRITCTSWKNRFVFECGDFYLFVHISHRNCVYLFLYVDGNFHGYWIVIIVEILFGTVTDTRILSHYTIYDWVTLLYSLSYNLATHMLLTFIFVATKVLTCGLLHVLHLRFLKVSFDIVSLKEWNKTCGFLIFA